MAANSASRISKHCDLTPLLLSSVLRGSEPLVNPVNFSYRDRHKEKELNSNGFVGVKYIIPLKLELYYFKRESHIKIE